MNETPITNAEFNRCMQFEDGYALVEMTALCRKFEREREGRRALLQDIRDHQGGNRYNYAEITELIDNTLDP